MAESNQNHFFNRNKKIELGNVLITGGLGFIGYNLALHIIANYSFDNMFILDMKAAPSFSGGDVIFRDPRIKCLTGSILDEASFDGIDVDLDYIIHTAGVLGIGYVAENSILTLDSNIGGTRNCLEFAAYQKNLKRFVTFSTSEVYGIAANDSFEDTPAIVPTTGKRWCYSASKLAAEHYTLAFAREKGVPFSIIRPFNVYGPYRSGSNAMSTFIERALQDQEITISGDGTQKRSWCYVDDFVAGVAKIMITQDAANEAFNLGNPENYLSIKDLAALIIDLSGSESSLSIEGGETEDVLSRRPEIRKAQNIVNYKPRISLEEGIQETMKWIQLKRMVAQNEQAEIIRLDRKALGRNDYLDAEAYKVAP